jgi:hypothetical protein
MGRKRAKKCHLLFVIAYGFTVLRTYLGTTISDFVNAILCEPTKRRELYYILEKLLRMRQSTLDRGSL